MANAKTKAELIAKHEYDVARKLMGSGWDHISPDLQRGLVFANIVGVIRNQDDSIDPKTVLKYLDDLCNAADILLTK